MNQSKGALVSKQEIRLQYSGFIIFAAKMLSVATGLIFQFLVAWSTSEEQYGIWFNVNDVLAYFTILVGVAPFWVMRFVARGKEGSTKTGFVTNLIVSVISTIAYLAFVPFFLPMLGISADFLPVYFIASLQIVELYALTLFEGCLQATIPQTIGYGLLVQQVGKVALGYVLIVQMGQPLIGALAATIIAIGIQLFYYTKILADQFKQKIRWGYVKQWLKGSLANIYNVIGSQIAAYVFIMLYEIGGAAGRGRYGAAATITNVISYASFLAFALYPKLLAERKKEDVTTSLKMVLMFAIPMTVVAIVMANSYITILRRDYPDAGIVLVVLALDALILVTNNVFSAVLFGMESLDQDEKISFKALVRSRLFVAFSLPYVQSVIMLPVTYFVLTTYAFNQPLQAAFFVSMIIAISHLFLFIILYALVRKAVKVDIPWKSISKYVLASAVAGALLFFLPHPAEITVTATTMEIIFYIGEVLVLTAVGAVVYLVILMAIDKEARELPKAMLQEIRGKKSANVQS
jgi:O-antigen/teichoic acid export membrane protein